MPLGKSEMASSDTRIVLENMYFLMIGAIADHEYPRARMAQLI
jgi:hypothetical protein